VILLSVASMDERSHARSLRESEMGNKEARRVRSRVKNGSNTKSKPSFPTAANLGLYGAWNEPSLHELTRKTLEKHCSPREARFTIRACGGLWILYYLRARARMYARMRNDVNYRYLRKNINDAK